MCFNIEGRVETIIEGIPKIPKGMDLKVAQVPQRSPE
jgi:hypothetical protein